VAEQLESARVRVYPLNARGATDILAILRLGRLVRRRKYDTVFSFLVHANVAVALIKPFFPDMRFIQSIQTTQPNPGWHWKAQAVAQHAADAVVVPSESVALAAIERSHVRFDKIAIISNAIDPAEFSSIRSDATRERMYSAEPVPIGFIGRLDPIKRIPDLIEAVAHLDGRVHLHVFGDGPERDRLERQIAYLLIESRVTLHGSVPHPRDALGQIGLLVLPSEAEGFGLVLIEAMAAGVPVVATNAPGIRNVVRHDVTGLLVPVGSPRDLAGAIRRVLDDHPLRQRLIFAAGAEVLRRFTWDAVLPKYWELLGLAEGTSASTSNTDLASPGPA
jgi:glycosyltransferase involved in cell wall biosynthesis